MTVILNTCLLLYGRMRLHKNCKVEISIKGCTQMTWYRIHLTLDQNLAGLQSQVRDAFDEIWLASGNNSGMALFAVCYSPDRDIDVFISPKLASVASSLLSHFKATSCQPPSRDTEDIGLLLGNPAHAWSLLS